MRFRVELNGRTVDYTAREAAQVLGVTEEWIRRRCWPAEALSDGRVDQRCGHTPVERS